MGIKKLTAKYFVEGDDGLHINKAACKESANTAIFTATLVATAVVGALAIIGLASIGLDTVKTGVRVVKTSAEKIPKIKFKK